MSAAIQQQPEGPTLRAQVAEEVRVWLARRRVSGAQLARELGRSQTFIQKRLDGRQAFDVDDLEQIARILDVNAADFLPGASVHSLACEPGWEAATPLLTLVPDLDTRCPVAPDTAYTYAAAGVTQRTNPDRTSHLSTVA